MPFLDISTTIRRKLVEEFPVNCPVSPVPPIFYPNTDQHPNLDNNQIFLQFMLFIGSQVPQSTINSSIFGRGIMAIDIYVPKNTGTYKGHQLADHLEKIFVNKTIKDGPLVVYMQSMSMEELPMMSGEYQFWGLRTETQFENYSC